MKKKILILIGIMGIILPLKTNALTGSVSINCSKTTIAPGESTSCTISGSSSEGVSALSANLTSSGSINISNISTSSSWQGNGEGGNIELYTDANKTGTFQIGSFTITGTSEGAGTLNIKNVSFSDGSFNEFGISSKSLPITVKTPEQPVQNNDVSNNSSSTSNINTNTNISANNQNNKSSNANTSTNNTNNKNNAITSSVVKEVKSNDATLKVLELSSGFIEFSQNITEYQIEVSNDVEKIEISAVANNANSIVDIPNDLSLKTGENRFEIKVTAEDGTAKIYTIIVNKLDRKLSSNSSLKELVIENYKIVFSSDVYEYNLGNITTNKLIIKAVVNDDNSKVEIIGNESIGKKDAVIIKVTAEDGTISNYIIYANNIENKAKSIILLILSYLVFIASLVVNFVFVFKKLKKKKTIIID